MCGSLSDNFTSGHLYLILPIMTLVIHEAGVLIRMARASTLKFCGWINITHARAKGLSEQAFLWKHALRMPLARQGQ